MTKFRQQAFLHSFARDHCRNGTEVAKELMKAAVTSKKKAVSKEVNKVLTHLLEKLDTDWDLTWLAGVGDKRWASSLLNYVIRHGAESESLEEAVIRHVEWREDPALGMGSLCCGLVESLGASDVMRLIFRALERGESLNLRHVCSVVRVTCLTCPDSPRKWLKLLQPLISESLKEENTRRLILGLFLVRHVTFSVTTPGTCPTYLTWLNENANVEGEASVFCGNVKASSQFLVTVLTKLVSRDPEPVLKAQVGARMSVLAKHSREGWEEYKQLARSRLDSLTSTAREEISVAPLTVKTRATVTSYVQEWAKTGRMAPELTQDIMFRMPMFESQLLPGLLSVSLNSEELEAAREHLVTELHKKGKVPPTLYSK